MINSAIPRCDDGHGICHCIERGDRPSHIDATTLLGSLARNAGQDEGHFRRTIEAAGYQVLGGWAIVNRNDVTHAMNAWLGVNKFGMLYLTSHGLDVYVARRVLHRDQSLLPEPIWFLDKDNRVKGKPLAALGLR